MAKTNAEIQATHRRKMKEMGFTARLIWVKADEPTPGASAPAAPVVKTAKPEKLKAAKERAWVEAGVKGAIKLAKREPIAAQVLLATLEITESRALASGLKTFDLSPLKTVGAWEAPPAEFMK